MISRILRAFKRPVRVEHVRYVNKPARDAIHAKCREQCARMGRDVPEALK